MREFGFTFGEVKDKLKKPSALAKQNVIKVLKTPLTGGLLWRPFLPDVLAMALLFITFLLLVRKDVWLNKKVSKRSYDFAYTGVLAILLIINTSRIIVIDNFETVKEWKTFICRVDATAFHSKLLGVQKSIIKFKKSFLYFLNAGFATRSAYCSHTHNVLK